VHDTPVVGVLGRVCRPNPAGDHDREFRSLGDQRTPGPGSAAAGLASASDTVITETTAATPVRNTRPIAASDAERRTETVNIELLIDVVIDAFTAWYGSLPRMVRCPGTSRGPWMADQPLGCSS
jgi:hypothetical protein